MLAAAAAAADAAAAATALERVGAPARGKGRARDSQRVAEQKESNKESARNAALCCRCSLRPRPLLLPSLLKLKLLLLLLPLLLAAAAAAEARRKNRAERKRRRRRQAKASRARAALPCSPRRSGACGEAAAEAPGAAPSRCSVARRDAHSRARAANENLPRLISLAARLSSMAELSAPKNRRTRARSPLHTPHAPPRAEPPPRLVASAGAPLERWQSFPRPSGATISPHPRVTTVQSAPGGSSSAPRHHLGKTLRTKCFRGDAPNRQLATSHRNPRRSIPD